MKAECRKTLQGGRPTRVLVIDDNADDRLLVLRTLSREFGVLRPTQVMDARSLEQAMGASQYDLIVMDFRLNWTTGLDLIPLLKARLDPCPIIMFTDSGNEEIAVEAMKAGADDYVLKALHRLPRLAATARAQVEGYAARKRAANSGARMERLLSRLKVGVYRRNLEGSFISANAAFLEIFGFDSFDQVTGPAVDSLVRDPEALERMREAGRRDGTALAGELRMIRRDGTEIWVSLSLAISPENPDEVEGMVEDITVRKGLEKALKEKRDALKHAEKLEAIGRLAGGVAHDFNNHLTAITGYADMVLESISADSTVRGDMVEIQKAGLRVTKITRDLLAFGRRQMLRNRIMDLDGVIRSLEADIRGELGADLGFETRLDASLYPIRVDAAQIETVILNLVANSRDALHSGGRITVETGILDIPDEGGAQVLESYHSGPFETIRPGYYVSLSIADTGAGMDPETVARIFEPFFSTKGCNKRSGLGLSTVYGIIKQSNGHIFVKSAPGAGTEFRILLPAVSIGLKAEAPLRRVQASA
ncbi:MAG: response receiver sensor histidine kinase response regulator [Fibrobacteres bacterium]|nr:response receiver sensor histidine kinase response regulator [Fibrobacterota bacterium]